ncbi:PEP-CTERM sorting domain-containing protein [Chamaesiphon sp. OTE_20_metabat_361]|uniref:PEP-CTERM sorting domain-containing protein n=1 Tax=Chamaesiphon sp. OTE_20_metabat_361 TaxID=2964689 RepID=UPI00286A9173|nr:PEP-CTERM sorting domain-containing protein [Chamaesiphon sp. OTE_20_metabat_361]
MFANTKIAFTSTSILFGFTALISSFVIPNAQAATFNYTETTMDAPTWNRPVENFNSPPTAIAGASGEAVSYSSFGFTVSDPDNYVFQSTANFDNYTFLYQNSFNPTNPLLNILIGNDDNPTIGLSGFTTALTAGTNYFLVTTGFDNPDVGTFSNTITGVGNVTPTAVPEPATILGSLVAIGSGVYARRRIKFVRSTDKNNF